MNQYWSERWKRKNDEDFFKYLSAMATIYAARKWREDFANGTIARHKIKVGDKEVETITKFGAGPYSDTRLFADYKKWLKEQENIEP